MVAELKRHGLWIKDVCSAITCADGSVRGMVALLAGIRSLFRSAWELPQRALIDMAAARTRMSTGASR